MLEAFFLTVKIFISPYPGYPPKFSGQQRILPMLDKACLETFKKEERACLTSGNTKTLGQRWETFLWSGHQSVSM